MLLYSTENWPQVHLSISRYSIITVQKLYFHPNIKNKTKNYHNEKQKNSVLMQFCIIIFCIIWIVKYLYTMVVFVVLNLFL